MQDFETEVSPTGGSSTTVTVNANVVLAAYAQAFFDNFSHFDSPTSVGYSAVSTGEGGDATPSWTYATHYLHTITQEGGSWLDTTSTSSSSDITIQSAAVTSQRTKQHSMSRSVMDPTHPNQISLACWHEIRSLLNHPGNISPIQAFLPSSRSPTQGLLRHPSTPSPAHGLLRHPSNHSPAYHPKGQYEAPPLIEDSDEEFSDVSTDSCDSVPEDQHNEWPPLDDIVVSKIYSSPSGPSGCTNVPRSLPKELPSETHTPVCVESQRRWRSLPNRHHPRYGSTRHNSEVPITFPWPYDVVIDTHENARMNAGASVSCDDSMFMLADLNETAGLNAGAFCKYMCSRILSDVTIHIIPDEVALPHLRAIREIVSHTR